MRTSNVVAFDPGERTGIAVWCDGSHRSWDAPEDEAMDWFTGPLLELYVPDLVVSESIIITPHTARKGQQVQASIRQIGVVKHTCRTNLIEFVTQPPAEAKGFCSNDLLHRLDWWSTSDHARDASRHLALALAKRSPEFRRRAVSS